MKPKLHEAGSQYCGISGRVGVRGNTIFEGSTTTRKTGVADPLPEMCCAFAVRSNLVPGFTELGYMK